MQDVELREVPTTNRKRYGGGFLSHLPPLRWVYSLLSIRNQIRSESYAASLGFHRLSPQRENPGSRPASQGSNLFFVHSCMAYLLPQSVIVRTSDRNLSPFLSLVTVVSV
ncbi:hypothetical protein NIES4073_28730 [Kalymmatonema gypsitolerans NIES-4073]|nr:hypothetical protein NIES4073_28730 [Scytonema sp. NIES-4073]